MATEKAAAKAKKPLTVKVELTEIEKENKQLSKGRLESYVVPEKEEGHIHVEVERVKINSATGVKESSARVVKLDPRAWNNFRKQALKIGFNHVRVLYAPEGTNLEVVDPVKSETKEISKN